MYSKKDYQSAFEQFKAQNPVVWRRYETPGQAAAELLLAYMIREQQPPSLITTELSIKALVHRGLLVRVDGLTQAEENQQRLAEMTQRIEQPALTKEEIEYFQALHPRDLEQRYWQHGGSNEFRIRFDKCVRERPFGSIFVAPGKPSAAADDEVETVQLTAAEYRATRANDIIRKIKSVPGYRAAVEKLIANSEI